MAKKFLVNVDLNGNQLLSARAHNGSASPTAYGKGQLWFDTTNNQLNVYDGSTFNPLATGGTAVSSLNGLTGGVTIYGTTNQIAVTASSGSVTISLPSTISTTTACATNFYGTFNGTASNSTNLGGQASTYYAPINSPAFTGTVDLGTNVATGSVSTASNSLHLDGTAASAYALLSSANFTAASISGNAIATQSYVTGTAWSNSSASVGTATNSSQLGGTAASSYALLSSANFTAASVGSSRVITTSDKFIAASAAVTSSELAGIISDETGSGSLVFNTSPTFAGTVNLGPNTATGSVSYATNAGNSTTTSQTTFSNLTSSGSVIVQSTTQSTSTSTGALTVAGGAGIAKNVYIGGDLNVTGSVYVSGSAFTISSSNVVINDPMIYLGDNNNANISDLGFIVSFNDGTYQHSGLVRDASDGKWKLFSGVIPEPDTTVNFASATYDTLQLGALIVNSSSTTTTASITSSGSATFAALIKSGGTSSQFLKADGSVDSTTYAPLNSPTFTGTVNLGSNTATGSVSYATNSGSLGGTAAGSYALLSSANFTAASVGGNAVATQTYVTGTAWNNTSASVSYAASAATSASTSQTDFTSLSISGSNVATQTYVTSASVADSAKLGGTAASAYAQLSSANFTAASVGSIAVARKFVGTITGNSSANSFAITHNMGTQDVTTQVYQTSATPDTQYAEVEVDIVRTSASVVTVSFATAPATGTTYNVVIVG